jgi:hypothetical protein
MLDDVPRGEGPHTDRPDHSQGSIPARAAPSAYQSTLLRIIESTTNDPAQLRRLVYQLARLNLKRETWQSSPTFTPAEVGECLRALETAITRVETDLSRGELAGLAFPRLTAEPEGLLNEPTRIGQTNPQRLRAPEAAQLVDDSECAEMANLQAPCAADNPEGSAFPAWLAHPQSQKTGGAVPVPRRQRERWSSPEPATLRPSRSPGGSERPQVEIVYSEPENSEVTRLRRRAWRWFIAWPLILITVPVTLSIALYLAIAGKLGNQDAQTRLAALEKGRPSIAVEETAGGAPSGLPLPSKYGVYAISNGALSELEALPIRAPDPRVMLSAEISNPSTILLPDGKVIFGIFRRDLVNSAPQKAAVRVVARVARVMSFGAGKLVTTNVQNSWRIRSNSYDFNVSPMSETREMVAIRPEAADFVLPAGRYALVLSGMAYDFTVDGPVTDPAQCLESFAAANGPVFTQCRPN